MFPGPRTSDTARIRWPLTLANVGGDSPKSKLDDADEVLESACNVRQTSANAMASGSANFTKSRFVTNATAIEVFDSETRLG
jgi:hypothetical protein